MAKTKELNCDSQVYLYAKHWFLESKNPFDDLRKIYAVRNGVNAEHISDADILDMVVCLAYQHITNEHQFRTFVFSCFEGYRGKSPFSVLLKSTTQRKVLRQLLKILRFTKVKDDNMKVLIPLDKPDYTILPPKKETK